MKPFIKWAGGKTQLLPEIVSRLPPGNIDYYIEPFLGGGAVFLHLLEAERINKAVLTDNNQSLINAWNMIKNDTSYLIHELERIEFNFNFDKTDKKEYYYSQREKFNFVNQFDARHLDHPEKVKQTARFIFLNKTNFNGLFRINRLGLYNVPYGRYKSFRVDEENINEIGISLRKRDIKFARGDFSWIRTVADAFIYLDPPYMTDGGFTSYSGEFDLAEQERLADVVRSISGKNKLMISNSFHSKISELYSGFTMHVVRAKRNINRDGSGRGKVDELIIINYE